ncbi:HSP20-like chaperone [Cercophora newfieldiana]|uniref:HSP20-like chaperone n=1 Tax=Cercophora newfieldiana TaxID=92897 RepID=A0AA40CV56_9PEZI|nr:HSP20-like chaperone [Cercophora newfieldiana]
MSIFYPRSYSAAPGFSSLFRMLDDFEKYAQTTLGNPMSNPFGGLATLGSSTGMQTIAPKFDVTEHEKDYSLQGELPGVPPENVVIEFTDPQTLVIHGHAEREHTEGDPSLARIGGPEETKKIEGSGGGKKMEGKKENMNESKEGTEGESKKPTSKYWLNERSFGEFSRVFNFPSSVDQDHVEAKFNHGLLSVMVPKATKKGARKIEIK